MTCKACGAEAGWALRLDDYGTPVLLPWCEACDALVIANEGEVAALVQRGEIPQEMVNACVTATRGSERVQ